MAIIINYVTISIQKDNISVSWCMVTRLQFCLSDGPSQQLFHNFQQIIHFHFCFLVF